MRLTSHGTPAGSAEPAEIDTSRAHAARVYDYLLGGRANFKVDREAAEITYASFPGGIDGVRADVREHRAALGRVVRYFVEDAGITQFLDIGTGIPKENNVHEVAQAGEPDARIVYVDWDHCKSGCAHAGTTVAVPCCSAPVPGMPVARCRSEQRVARGTQHRT